MRPVTRRERRAERQRRYAVAREVRRSVELEDQVSDRENEIRAQDDKIQLPEWLRPLDFRVSGESGALIVHTHSLSWHRTRSPNITIPPPGRGWDKSSPTRVVEIDEGFLSKQDTHLSEISQ